MLFCQLGITHFTKTNETANMEDYLIFISNLFQLIYNKQYLTYSFLSNIKKSQLLGKPESY